MADEVNNRLDLSCLIANIPITIVTRFGTVYQGTVLDWGCGRSNSYEGNGGFIRMELTCRPGQICCDETPVDTPAIVNGIRSSVNNAYPLFEVNNSVLINWADISSIGPQRDCLTA